MESSSFFAFIFGMILISSTVSNGVSWENMVSNWSKIDETFNTSIQMKKKTPSRVLNTFCNTMYYSYYYLFCISNMEIAQYVRQNLLNRNILWIISLYVFQKHKMCAIFLMMLAFLRSCQFHYYVKTNAIQMVCTM